MLNNTHPQGTNPLFGLDQVFELEPRWGSPVFEEGDVLDLSNRKQTVRIQLAFKDASKVLVGHTSARSTDELNMSADETLESLTELQQKALQTPVTDEERARADELLNAVLPIVGLQDFSAEVFGVSRKHAVLERDGRHIVLTDLYSTNGTRLNGTSLFPMQRHILRNGDALQLGALQLRVRFRRGESAS